MLDALAEGLFDVETTALETNPREADDSRRMLDELVSQSLALINETLDTALAEQDGDFDPDSRWAPT